MIRWVGLLLIASALAGEARADSTPGERVDAIFAEVGADGPGCAVGVMSAGELVLSRGYGQANLDHAVPIGADSVFDIGSVSKQFTAAAIALLAERGRLSLDDRVGKHVPELPAPAARATVRQLVHHTSGIRDYLDLLAMAGLPERNVYTLDDLVALIATQQELNFPPGTRQLYSNSGYLLLAVIAERVSGRPLGAFLSDQVFAPLGMHRTLVYDDASRVIPGRATGYSPREEGGFAVDHYFDFALPGDGQVYTTVGDLARWQRALETGAVDGPGFAESLLEPGRLSDGTQLDYAFGLRVGELRGLRTVRHGGAWGGFRAHALRFRDEALSVLVLCNHGGLEPERLAEEIAEVYLGDHLEPAPALESTFTPSIVALEGLEGGFRGRESGEVWRVGLHRGALSYRALAGGSRQPLVPVAPGRFRGGAEPPFAEVRFEAGRDGRRQMLVTRGGSVELYDELPPLERGAAGLAAYAGSYRHDGLGVSYALEPLGGALRLKPTRGPVRELWPISRDVFFTEGWLVEFERDDSGAVTALTVSGERAWRVRFRRLDG